MAEELRDLDRELRELASRIETGVPSPALTTAVMERVAAEPVPERSGLGIALGRAGQWARARLRWVAAALLALVGAGVVVSPVGAEVVEWFDFGGVVVRTGPGAPSGTPEVPAAERGLTVEEAGDLAGFEPRLPAELGAPDGVEATADRRLVSLSWQVPGTGTVRLDQFQVELAPYFWKSAPEARHVTVGSVDGIWFPGPHEVVLLDEVGRETTVPPRLAAQTLVWVVGDRTFRLEGDLDQARAIEIATSVR